jgi:peptidyl-prolyl cis-trans isomerase-like protein 2
LDGKHTVFGRLVGGATTFCAMENAETDKEDRPVQPILFMKAEVFVDPFEEAAKTVEKERESAKNNDGKGESQWILLVNIIILI